MEEGEETSHGRLFEEAVTGMDFLIIFMSIY